MDEEEGWRQLLIAMQYVLFGLLVLAVEGGLACWLLWRLAYP